MPFAWDKGRFLRRQERVNEKLDALEKCGTKYEQGFGNTVVIRTHNNTFEE